MQQHHLRTMSDQMVSPELLVRSGLPALFQQLSQQQQQQLQQQQQYKVSISSVKPILFDQCTVTVVEFNNLYESTLDATCLLETPHISKRTAQNNPWITEGTITAVNRKHELKKDWTDTVTKKNPDGDASLHKIFCDYRRVLKSVINNAKNSHIRDRILESKQDKK